MTPDLAEYYVRETSEDTRLTRSAHGKLEFLRTRELVRRALSGTRLRVLDVGGGTGIHARWLAADGHAVHVVDPVARHVEAAAAIEGVTAELGDARNLSCPDDGADVVLLLGPLYHLIDREDRAQALAEARRVLRPGGVLLAAAISRYLELRDELQAAGMREISVYGVEGPAWAALDVAGVQEFDARMEAALRCARMVEQDPLLVNASAHFLATALR